jgi:hypothetical protein
MAYVPLVRSKLNSEASRDHGFHLRTCCTHKLSFDVPAIVPSSHDEHREHGFRLHLQIASFNKTFEAIRKSITFIKVETRLSNPIGKNDTQAGRQLRMIMTDFLYARQRKLSEDRFRILSVAAVV